MSALADALAALKNVVLIQERLDVMRRDVGEMVNAIQRMEGRVIQLDSRVARLEGFVEGAAAASGQPTRLPRIEDRS